MVPCKVLMTGAYGTSRECKDASSHAVVFAYIRASARMHAQQRPACTYKPVYDPVRTQLSLHNYICASARMHAQQRPACTYKPVYDPKPLDLSNIGALIITYTTLGAPYYNVNGPQNPVLIIQALYYMRKPRTPKHLKPT